MKYIVGTQYLCIALRAYKTSFLKWHTDAAFAAHLDLK